MKQNHSPLPWKIEDGQGHFAVCSLGNSTIDGKDYEISMNGYAARDGIGESDAKLDAEFIVKCVNMHDELVEALDGLLTELEDFDQTRVRIVAAKAALAKAQS